MKWTTRKVDRLKEVPLTARGKMPWHHRNTFPHSPTVRWVLSATPLSALGIVVMAAGAVWSGIALIVAALTYYRWLEFRRR